MHPSFSDLFVHPESHKPLTFLGNTVKGRWTNGLLWASGEHEMYPVIKSIPIFALPPDQTWAADWVRRLRREKWIERNWNNGGKEKRKGSELTQFSDRIAQTGGLILDVASGPGGGFVPQILQANPDAKVLLDDLVLGVLQEWQRLLRRKGILSVSFALFDATKMPLKSESIDIVSDLGGFDNISWGFQGIKESYRVLKPEGSVFSMNSMINKEDFLKLPPEIRTRMYDYNPPFFDGFKETFEQSGFDVISHKLLKERELSPEQGDLAREADKHGVRLRVIHYCTEARKRRSIDCRRDCPQVPSGTSEADKEGCLRLSGSFKIDPRRSIDGGVFGT